MGNLAPVTEQFQHFLRNLKESFWGELYGKTRQAWKEFLVESRRERDRDRYMGLGWYERGEEAGRDYRNGFYERDFLTVFGRSGCESPGRGRRTFCPRA